MAECVLPQDIMLCILTRLPLKPLIRFKCVCKQWRGLFASPKFIEMHRQQFSNDPRNEAFIVYNLRDVYYEQSMPLFSIDSNEKELTPTDLDFPDPISVFSMGFVGCCNGLICLAGPSTAWMRQDIILWNPGLRLLKFVSPPSEVKLVGSLGFGYDYEDNDFKAVRVISFGEENMRFGGQVYSAKSDSWKTIDGDSGVIGRLLTENNRAIVNGNPCWIVFDYGYVRKLVWFDMTKLVFRMVPLSALKLDGEAAADVVDWKGSLAVVCTKVWPGPLASFDVWVFDDGEIMWRKKHTFGPITMNVDRCVQCSKDGKIIGMSSDRKVFVYDTENRCVKPIQIDKELFCGFMIFGYTESFAYIEGMIPEKEQV